MNDDYMISFQNETKQTIEASYKKMTAVERSVADFFICTGRLLRWLCGSCRGE